MGATRAIFAVAELLITFTMLHIRRMLRAYCFLRFSSLCCLSS